VYWRDIELRTETVLHRSRSQREPVRRLTPGLPFDSPPGEDLPAAVNRNAMPQFQAAAPLPALWQDPRLQQQKVQAEDLHRHLQQQQQLQQQQRLLLEQRLAQQARSPGPGLLPAWAQSQVGDPQAQLQQYLREQQLQQLQMQQQQQQRQQLLEAQARAAAQQQQDAGAQAVGPASPQAAYAAPWAQLQGQPLHPFSLQRSLQQAAAQAPLAASQQAPPSAHGICTAPLACTPNLCCVYVVWLLGYHASLGES